MISGKERKRKGGKGANEVHGEDDEEDQINQGGRREKEKERKLRLGKASEERGTKMRRRRYASKGKEAREGTREERRRAGKGR